MWQQRSFWKGSLQLTSLLHEDKELIQELLPLWVAIQLVQLQIEKQMHRHQAVAPFLTECCFALQKRKKILTLAKSRDGSPLTFPPSFSSAQMAPPLCKHTHTLVQLYTKGACDRLRTLNTEVLHYVKRYNKTLLFSHLFLSCTPPIQHTRVMQLC